eukprot:4168928-Amphidinium_carterae.1
MEGTPQKKRKQVHLLSLAKHVSSCSCMTHFVYLGHAGLAISRDGEMDGHLAWAKGVLAFLDTELVLMAEAEMNTALLKNIQVGAWGHCMSWQAEYSEDRLVLTMHLFKECHSERVTHKTCASDLASASSRAWRDAWGMRAGTNYT